MSLLPRFVIAIVAFAGLQSAQAACTYPPEITIPDGNAATKEQMLAANGAMKEYQAKVNEYLDCLDKEEADLGDAATPEQKELHVSRHNAAVDALEAIAARYNEQVRAFKKKQAG
jgi:hypothetical protein